MIRLYSYSWHCRHRCQSRTHPHLHAGQQNKTVFTVPTNNATINYLEELSTGRYRKHRRQTLADLDDRLP